jgi:hypothetical protein
MSNSSYRGYWQFASYYDLECVTSHGPVGRQLWQIMIGYLNDGTVSSLSFTAWAVSLDILGVPQGRSRRGDAEK